MKNWKKNSWRKYPVKHIPEYPNKKELDSVLDKIGTFPPLVFAGETRHLKDQLADVVDGKAFLLQGGDLSLIHISEPTRLRRISYAVFCLKKKKQTKRE